jgi:hypothetical protein
MHTDQSALQSATPKAPFGCQQATSIQLFIMYNQASPAALNTAITARMPAQQHTGHTQSQTAAARAMTYYFGCYTVWMWLQCTS